MKNNVAGGHNGKQSKRDNTASLFRESATASVWTPDYVLRLRQNIHCCRCPGCNGASPLLQFRWNNHVRHSADISCNRAAAEILSLTAPCVLTFSHDLAEHLPAVSHERLQMNHHCLQLFEAYRNDPALLLYVLHGFIHQCRPLDPTRRAALAQDWLKITARQRLEQDFCRQYGEKGYPPLVLQKGENLPMEGVVDQDVRLQKWIERRDRPEETRGQTEWEQHRASSAQQKILTNFLFYELCHNFFPGHPVEEWENNFTRLCQRVRNLLLLLAAIPPEQDKESVCALFATSLRAARKETFSG